MRLANKFIAVTGAAMGIGKCIAETLAAQGATVAITDVNEEAALQTAEGIRQKGGAAQAWQLDVTNRAQIKSVITAIVEKFGRLDVWVNNAGVSTMKPFLELTEQDWDFLHNVNGSGVFFCSQEVARHFIRQGNGGKIINIASMAGKRGGNAPFLVHYVYTKFGVIGLTQAMAKELSPYQITVNAVCPGYVATPMQKRELVWEGQLRGISPEAVYQSYIDDTPLGRIEQPEDIAKTVLFLASSDSDFITGEAINVNGGAWMD
ncbi:MAG: SDR family oxidoreductase [Chloroflexi bacterium]|nr:SDR family oxidoreductase [Chloroflexota bacterium]